MQTVFIGKVGDGYGGAAGDVRKGDYVSLSTDLYPGTLNIYTPDSPWTLPMPPERTIYHDGARCMIWPATLELGGGIDVWAMWPQHYPVQCWNVIEILSEYHLRKEFSLVNGDEVTVCLKTRTK